MAKQKLFLFSMFYSINIGSNGQYTCCPETYTCWPLNYSPFTVKNVCSSVNTRQWLFLLVWVRENVGLIIRVDLNRFIAETYRHRHSYDTFWNRAFSELSACGKYQLGHIVLALIHVLLPGRIRVVTFLRREVTAKNCLDKFIYFSQSRSLFYFT